MPQAGTGGYGIRPYVFVASGAPAQRAVPRVELSPFVESEIRRGAFYMRPRKFALPQAGTGGYGIRPYVFCRGGEGRVFPCCVCRGDHWSPANLPPQRIFRDSCLVRQAGTGEQCSPLQEFSPVWARNIPARRTVLSPTACGRSPLAEGAKRGARFCLLCVQADLFPLAPCQKPSYVVYYFSTSPQANPVQTGDAKL